MVKIGLARGSWGPWPPAVPSPSPSALIEWSELGGRARRVCVYVHKSLHDARSVLCSQLVQALMLPMFGVAFCSSASPVTHASSRLRLAPLSPLHYLHVLPMPPHACTTCELSVRAPSQQFGVQPPLPSLPLPQLFGSHGVAPSRPTSLCTALASFLSRPRQRSHGTQGFAPCGGPRAPRSPGVGSVADWTTTRPTRTAGDSPPPLGGPLP